MPFSTSTATSRLRRLPTLAPPARPPLLRLQSSPFRHALRRAAAPQARLRALPLGLPRGRSVPLPRQERRASRRGGSSEETLNAAGCAAREAALFVATGGLWPLFVSLPRAAAPFFSTAVGLSAAVGSVTLLSLVVVGFLLYRHF